VTAVGDLLPDLWCHLQARHASTWRLLHPPCPPRSSNARNTRAPMARMASEAKEHLRPWHRRLVPAGQTPPPAAPFAPIRTAAACASSRGPTVSSRSLSIDVSYRAVMNARLHGRLGADEISGRRDHAAMTRLQRPSACNGQSESWCAALPPCAALGTQALRLRQIRCP
jgi:hypothetical protein